MKNYFVAHFWGDSPLISIFRFLGYFSATDFRLPMRFMLSDVLAHYQSESEIGETFEPTPHSGSLEIA